MPTPASSTSTIPPNAGVPSAQAERVIVTFNQSVPFSSSEFLLEMQRLTQARFSYIAPISNDSHVYGVQPLQGQTIAQVLQRLRDVPVVRSVEIDRKMKANQ
ncbi:MAG: hypothetical protein KA777_08940 [Rhodoferax sp.]|nr:hypothetical protein [Rhodoferax sp.]